MGCIVNGPGEMADADFGYVGSGPGKITLYKGKDVVQRGIDSGAAVVLQNIPKRSLCGAPAAGRDVNCEIGKTGVLDGGPTIYS